MMISPISLVLSSFAALSLVMLAQALPPQPDTIDDLLDDVRQINLYSAVWTAEGEYETFQHESKLIISQSEKAPFEELLRTTASMMKVPAENTAACDISIKTLEAKADNMYKEHYEAVDNDDAVDNLNATTPEPTHMYALMETNMTILQLAISVQEAKLQYGQHLESVKAKAAANSTKAVARLEEIEHLHRALHDLDGNAFLLDGIKYMNDLLNLRYDTIRDVYAKMSKKHNNPVMSKADCFGHRRLK